MTLYHLLTHTSGLSYASQTNETLAALRKKVDVARRGVRLKNAFRNCPNCLLLIIRAACGDMVSPRMSWPTWLN